MKSRKIHGWRGVALAAMAACALGPAGPAQAEPADTTADLRASAIARIRHYVNWPSDAALPSGPAEPETVIACIIGTGPDLAAALARQSSQRAPLDVWQLEPSSPRLASCEIVVFHELGAAETAAALRTLRPYSVLTIGASASFVQEGGMLALVERRQRLRMVVNLANTRRAGIALSSRLLQLAQVVDGEAR